MFVRTVYMVGDPAKVEDSLEALRTEGRQMLSEQPGYAGMGLFTDRELGKISIGSWWTSEQAMQDSFEALRERRDALLGRFSHSPTIDTWEVAAFEPIDRPGPGCGFRLTRLEFDPMDADLVADSFKGSALQRMKEVPGLIGASLFLNRAHGRGAAGAMYRDRDALTASRGAQAAIRDEAVGKAHSMVRAVEEFEVVLVDMPTPSPS
ncbi:antibiotic biosynthesis monooxygenase [Streptacidiphilus monticola]|jgi:heme-degrading monooxygenase HmoA|uniref:Antibiotic biosynthesis monooxygenase n=1 Tax=Streptacidiphilus monticola TaxID=2161674 RepID=A0ABW1G606_9ACTN